MSNIMIVIDQNNADCNCIADLAAAVAETGAAIINIDPACCMIEAAVPSHEVPTIAAMAGVSYVRNVFTYLCDATTRAA